MKNFNVKMMFESNLLSKDGAFYLMSRIEDVLVSPLVYKAAKEPMVTELMQQASTTVLLKAHSLYKYHLYNPNVSLTDSEKWATARVMTLITNETKKRKQK
ncbi:hypothetical protein [uncultured Shewanella sp.]|uniref:hypothetical protein n=1 Tax=uncultured Shewanella sp. TaxID=173975 RepID=UPI0026340790|nr:hypothetical protein [uncultured Shewanella sp.]